MKTKNFTTRAELLRAAADSIEMQEKAGVEPMCKAESITRKVITFPIEDIYFNGVIGYYEFPLAVVEGRQVWEGDTLYNIQTGFGAQAIANSNWNEWSWNPPKPKTVIVELPIEDAEHFSIQYLPVKYAPIHMRNLGNACRKALEELK